MRAQAIHATLELIISFVYSALVIRIFDPLTFQQPPLQRLLARHPPLPTEPVPLDQQSGEFQDVLGYEFYTVDPDSGRARELSQTGDPESQRLYWAKLDDLAHDMAELLEAIEEGPGEAPAQAEAPSERVTVYLAETTYDLREQRDAIRRELQGYDAVVLPDRPLPLVGPECEEMVREQLARSVPMPNEPDMRALWEPAVKKSGFTQ